MNPALSDGGIEQEKSPPVVSEARHERSVIANGELGRPSDRAGCAKGGNPSASEADQERPRVDGGGDLDPPLACEERIPSGDVSENGVVSGSGPANKDTMSSRATVDM